jgi:hypothetical protein
LLRLPQLLSPFVGAASVFGLSVSDLRSLLGLIVGWELLLDCRLVYEVHMVPPLAAGTVY